jgi:hypothetical protein
VFLASDDDGAAAEIGALAENLGFSPRGRSSDPGQRRNALSPGRRGRSAVRFRPLHPNKKLHVRSRTSLV